MNGIKLPDTETAIFIPSISLEECGLRCLKNCSCLAYTSADISVGGSGCITWGTELIDLRKFVDGGQVFYIRLAASELSSWRKKARHLSFETIITQQVSDDEGSRRNNTDLPLFDFETILMATQNFSIANQLGEGGFGIVYKEIAVKRLSKSSSQGLEEFRNEVILIAKLQHINLVRLVGYCIQGEEKMLIYEYMQNRSLDIIIFDKAKSSLLSLPMRIKIIIGIARGLVYLHQDSRFQIIHRDLKASNILLDRVMKPKISDFGLAKNIW